jgi:hypothetical protein
MREVEAKRKTWRQKAGDKDREFLGQHMIPVILGPKDRCFIIDHHHLARALHEEGVKSVLVTLVAVPAGRGHLLVRARQPELDASMPTGSGAVATISPSP